VAGNCGYGKRLSGSINAGNFLTSLLVNFSRRTLPHGISKKVRLHSILQGNCKLCVFFPCNTFTISNVNSFLFITTVPTYEQKTVQMYLSIM
jgi:hypothetical protein